MKTGFLILGLLLFGFCSFGMKKKIKKQIVLNGVFHLEFQEEDGRLQKVFNESSEIVFDIKTGVVSIYTGCNRITGSYKIKNSKEVKTRIVNSTRMACSENTENVFKNNFSTATHYKLIGDTLKLLTGKKVLIILAKRKAGNKLPEKENLRGEYKLASLFDGKEMIAIGHQKTSIKIDKEKINCNVGCNGISGNFKTDGANVAPLKLTMTEMYCKEVDVLERQFVEALNNVNSYSLENGNLLLLNKNVVLIILQRVDN